MEELRQTGIKEANKIPLIFQAIWKLGFRTRPPHYIPPITMFVIQSVFFAITFGTAMWFFVWRDEGFTFYAAAFASLIISIIFGGIMTILHMRARRKWGLSRWKDL